MTLGGAGFGAVVVAAGVGFGADVVAGLGCAGAGFFGG